MPDFQPIFVRRAATFVLAMSLPLAAAFAGPDLHNVRGVPNFHAVNDHLYRGGQPSGEGFRNLASAGFKTIVDLREDDGRSKDEKKLVKALGMKYVNIPMQGMHTPSDKSISHALKVLNEDKDAPVFIHCKRGADRTGVVLACYRVEHDGWSNQEALTEARGYGMSWYQFPLSRYVLAYRPRGSRGITGFGEDAVEAIKDLPKKATGIFK